MHVPAPTPDDAIEEPSSRRWLFLAWSIRVPMAFQETFELSDGYWHGWDEHRSVSMSVVHLTERGAPVAARRIRRRMPPIPGTPVDEMPPGVEGWAVIYPTDPPARASTALSGMLFIDGCVVIATITADDTRWARTVWQSIRHHPSAANGRDAYELVPRPRRRR